MVTRRRGFYLALAGFLVLWAAVLMTLATTLIPDGYWYSYYAVDYTYGFIRRGLAGELRGLFPPERYFLAVAVLRWIPTAVFTAALAALAWWAAVRSGRSDRRLLLAILIPVLPFGFAFGLFSARTDLYGATALVVFALALTRSDTTKSVYLVSAAYGLVMVPLTLMHEATPLLFGLGVLVALIVLASRLTAPAFWISAALALVPGIVTGLVVALFSKRGLSGQLCQLVPHGPMNHPLAGKPTLRQLLSGYHYYVDYHDVLCRAFLPVFDQSSGDAMRFVASLGPVALAASTIYGVAVLAISFLAIAHVSGVPVRRFGGLLSARRWAVLLGLVMFAPVFATGVDWVRWWVIIAFDLGIVFLLYAAGEPEADGPVSRRTLTVFAAGVVLLAVVPIGVIPGFGAPVPM